MHRSLMNKFELLLVTALITAGCAVAEDLPSVTEWPYHGGNPQSQQYSTMKQINSSNVGTLGLLWYSELPVQEGLVGNPLVKDGVVYQSVPRGGALATDVRTGATRWNFSPDFDFSGYSAMSMWSAHSTRGIGLDEMNVYVTGGCELYAVDRKSGKQVWKVRVCDPSQNLGIIAAPHTGGGKVFVGVTNAEQGNARGFAAAYDAKSGHELWRFYSVPGDPTKSHENKQMEIASKTWGVEDPGSGGGVWDGMTYDPQLDLLFFGTGDPNLWARLGEHYVDYVNKELLFTDSLIAVNASTGKYVWHFQFLQGDVWQLGEGAAHIVLADLPLRGKTRHVVMQAAKDGFFYLLDAKSGRFISANNYVPVTIYTIDSASGRLKVREEGRFWEHPDKPFVIRPALDWGAHSWQLSSYDRDTGLIYIPAFVNSSAVGKDAPEEKTIGRLVAWDPVMQTERWHVDHPVTINGGVLSTAGGLVFQGTPEGKLFAYQATDGKLLWSYDIKGIVLGAPSTVMVGDKQVILVPSGDGTGGVSTKVASNLSTTLGTIAAPSRLLAFALDGKAVLPPPAAKVMLEPARAPQPAELATKGKEVYGARQCGMCHGEGMSISGRSRIPDLRNIREGTLQAMPTIVRDGAYSSLGMPWFPDITEEEIKALQAYIINEAWVAYRAQTEDIQQGKDR